MINPQSVAQQIERPQGGLHIGPSSIDLHIANEKTSVGGYGDLFGPLRIGDEVTYSNLETERTETIKVGPGEFCLARSEEELDLDPNIAAEVSGRSSVGRLGLFVENAGLVDRGFSGTITLELYNATSREIRIPAGTRVAQLIFYEQEGHPNNSYDGKYNGQVEPTGSRMYADKELQE